MEEYEEVETGDFTAGDYIFLGGGVILIGLFIAFILKQVRKTFKNIHLKVGNKIELGIETKGE